MSALEQEIIDRFDLLDKDAQLRLAARLMQKAQEDAATLTPMSPQEGLDWLRSF